MIKRTRDGFQERAGGEITLYRQRERKRWTNGHSNNEEGAGELKEKQGKKNEKEEKITAEIEDKKKGQYVTE